MYPVVKKGFVFSVVSIKTVVTFDSEHTRIFVLLLYWAKRVLLRVE